MRALLMAMAFHPDRTDRAGNIDLLKQELSFRLENLFGSFPPITGHGHGFCVIPKAAGQLLAEPDVQFGGRERPDLGR